LYFIKEIEKLVRCAVCSFKALGYLSEDSSSHRASQHFSHVLTKVLYNRTKFSISFIKHKSLRTFVQAVGSYKAHTTANQIAHNMSIIL
jgi:hypothetical protein